MGSDYRPTLQHTVEHSTVTEVQACKDKGRTNKIIFKQMVANKLLNGSELAKK